jgi:hypothetical protein
MIRILDLPVRRQVAHEHVATRPTGGNADEHDRIGSSALEQTLSDYVNAYIRQLTAAYTDIVAVDIGG